MRGLAGRDASPWGWQLSPFSLSLECKGGVSGPSWQALQPAQTWRKQYYCVVNPSHDSRRSGPAWTRLAGRLLVVTAGADAAGRARVVGGHHTQR
jgi:hypothetical protein